MEIKQITSTEILPFFNSLSEKSLTNQKLLTEFLLKQVGVGFRTNDFEIKKGEYLPSKGYKIKIWPDELARFLIFLFEHKKEINSYLEFGTGTGGTFFVIDSYLRAINPNMGTSITIDKNNNPPRGFDEYQKLHPVQYLGINTYDFKMSNYDLCFIDANHAYKGVKCDYEKSKDCCKFIAFHDIVTINAKKPKQQCVRHLWSEIDSNNKLEIITDDPRIKLMSGIGVIWK